MGDCNSSSKGSGAGGGTGSLQQKIIDKAQKSLDYSKQNMSFQTLPKHLQANIDTQLKISDFLQGRILEGTSDTASETVTFGFKKIKDKRNVTIKVKNGKLTYTVKKGNKILRRDVDKRQCANEIAKYYTDVTRGRTR